MLFGRLRDAEGPNEAPVQGDPNGKSGLIGRHPSERRQGHDVLVPFKGVTGIEKPTMAHIHKGSKGTSGPRRRPVRDELQGVLAP